MVQLAMDWYYSKNLTQLGPVSEAELRSRIAAGEVAGTDMAWTEGMKDWQPVSAVETFRGLVPTASGNTAMASSPYAPPVSSPYPPAGMAPSAPTSGLAIASLVCGIMGLMTCLFLPGIPAVICGHMALKRISEAPGRLGGRGLATAGLVTGYLSIILMVLFAIMMLFGFMASSVRVHAP